MTSSKILTTILVFIILAAGFVPSSGTLRFPPKEPITEQAKQQQSAQQIPESPYDNGIVKNYTHSVVNPKYASEAEQITPDISNRFVVKLSPGTDPQKIAALAGAEIIRQGPLQFVTLALPQNNVNKTVTLLKKTPGVLNVQPLRKIRQMPAKAESNQAREDNKINVNKISSKISVKAMDVSVTDPLYSRQWGLAKIDAPKAWALGATGLGVTVAVIDTGVDLNHPDLKDNILSGYNAITGNAGNNVSQDNNGHGTHVAGIIAAEQNGFGIVGVAYQANILPVKALGSDGEGTDDCIADGIVWAADHGAKIINLSLGSDTQGDVLLEAIHYAANKGCLIVAAGGNQESDSNYTTITYPASDYQVVAVTATDSNDQVPSFSLTGPQAALAAPGVNIVSDYWDGSSGYASMDGTSMASPFAAGVAALVWSVHPELKAQQVKILLENSAFHLGAAGRNNSSGYGRVDAYWALKFAAKLNTFTSPANLDWAGGVVQGGTTNTQAALTIPARTFGLNPNLMNTVSLNGSTAPAGFPSGIQPVGDPISIQWSGTISELLNLSLITPNRPANTGLIGYIYRWSGTHWLVTGGGSNNATLTAGISEPGIYRMGYTSPPENHRIAGTDRVQTSVAISQAEYPAGADTVILARSDDYPDALAGVPLAFKLHAPILLTSTNLLPSSVDTEIQRLSPQKVILLGGTAAISGAIEQQLKASYYTVQRFGGANRYATAAQIATALGTLGQAVVVNGNNYPDALSMASVAGQAGIPVLLTDVNLPPETDSALRQLLASATIVAGGEGVVTPSTFNLLPNPTRLAGNDRYATNAAVIKAYPPQGSLLFLATGENFPDALTGGVFAALNRSDLLLLPPAGPSPPEQAAIQTLHNQTAYVFGGTGVVPQAIVQEVQSIVQ